MTEDDLAAIRYALKRASDPVAFPRIPGLADALQELASWIADNRQWQSGEARHWTSLLRDIEAAFDGSGSELQRTIRGNCDWAMVDIAASKGGLKAGRGEPPDQAIRRRLQRAGGAVTAALESQQALLAAWDDLVADQPMHERMGSARVLAELARLQGHHVQGVRQRLTCILADDLIEIQIARGEAPDAELRREVAGLDVAARLELARRLLEELPRRGRAVYWLFFTLAPMHWPWVLDIGESVTIYKRDWLEEVITGVGDVPSGIPLPEELCGERRYEVLGIGGTIARQREPRGDAPSLESDQHGQAGEDEIPQALMRVDLGEVALADSEELAFETAQATIAMAILGGGTPLTWRLEQSYVRYVDGREAGGSFYAPLLWTPTFEERDALSADRTLRALEEQAKSLGQHLPIRDPAVREVAQLAVWFRESQRAWEPGQLVLYDRVLEQAAGWAGVGNVGRFVGDYLRLPWIYERVRVEIRNAAWDVIFSDLRQFHADGSHEASQSEELRNDPALGIRAESDSWSINLQGVLRRVDWMLERVPEGPQRDRLARLRDRSRSGRAMAAWMDELDEDFQALAARARRIRNALVHGGPAKESTAKAALPFVQVLASDALWQCMQGRLEREDLVDRFVERRRRYEASMRRLRADDDPAEALFWDP